VCDRREALLHRPSSDRADESAGPVRARGPVASISAIRQTASRRCAPARRSSNRLSCPDGQTGEDRPARGRGPWSSGRQCVVPSPDWPGGPHPAEADGDHRQDAAGRGPPQSRCASCQPPRRRGLGLARVSPRTDSPARTRPSCLVACGVVGIPTGRPGCRRSAARGRSALWQAASRLLPGAGQDRRR
jgi:hypothetical protein